MQIHLAGLVFFFTDAYIHCLTAHISKEEMQQKFGENAFWVYELLRCVPDNDSLFLEFTDFLVKEGSIAPKVRPIVTVLDLVLTITRSERKICSEQIDAGQQESSSAYHQGGRWISLDTGPGR